MATATKRLRVTQLVRGRREDVFEAFGDPKLARKWAPEGCRMASFEADMRVGGKFRQVMRCGSDRHVAYGEYRKIVPDKEVAFTHQWEEDDPVETLVTVRFKPEKSGTEMVLSQTGFKDAASARGHKEGWSSALASFAKVFASSRRQRR
jgi:uncharacterized protein YndB with AHSA1/START domain